VDWDQSYLSRQSNAQLTTCSRLLQPGHPRPYRSTADPCTHHTHTTSFLLAADWAGTGRLPQPELGIQAAFSRGLVAVRLRELKESPKLERALECTGMATNQFLPRRDFLIGAALIPAAFASCTYRPARQRQLRVWATSDPHVGNDSRQEEGRRPRESLAEAIRQSESSLGFDWDLALCLGDFSGHQGLPPEEEGRQVVHQFAALSRHKREQFYCIAGNHDASPGGQWFRRWIDPLGENTIESGVDPQRRPYPVSGRWERYSFRVGNLVFAMMSDRNDYAPPVGRIRDGQGLGGRPAGAVTVETFDWWQNLVAENADSIVISTHHHML